MSKNKRDMLTISELIPYMKNKNIKFNLFSEDRAEEYLKINNNYFNLSSYKNNFELATNGENAGLYIDLDFAYLKDISIIDYRLRQLFFKIIINIEHYLKINILNKIEKLELEDGYRIVNLYLDKDYNDEKYPKKIHNSIFKKTGSEYYKRIFEKYDIDKDSKLENIPIWEFLEIITFGELVNFYQYFANEYQINFAKKHIYILREIVKLRNAVAHNSCILSNLGIKDNLHNPDIIIVKYLSNCGIEKEMRDNKLSNSRIRQMTYALYMFNIMVTSEGIKTDIKDSLNNLMFNRIIYHKEYYNSNDLLKSVYKYFCKIIKKYY